MSLGEHLLHRRYALVSCRNLDHQVRAVHLLPKASHLSDCALRIEGEFGRHFKTDQAVLAVAGIVHRTQHIARRLDVGYRDRLVDFRRTLAGGMERTQLVAVVIAAADRLLEDGGIRRHPPQAVVVD